MFGTKPLISRLEERYMRPPAPAPFIPPASDVQPRPDVVSHLLEPATRPPTVAEALNAIGKAIAATLGQDRPETIALFHKFAEFRNQVETHFREAKQARFAHLKSEDERLTTEGRALVEEIIELEKEASGVRATYNVAEEHRSQLSQRLSSLGQDPDRRDDRDEVFITFQEIDQWKQRAGEARAKLEVQQGEVSRIHNRLIAKENEIAKAQRELRQITEQRKAVRHEMKGEFVTGPHGLRSWKVEP